MAVKSGRYFSITAFLIFAFLTTCNVVCADKETLNEDVALLIETVKEQQKQIEELKSEMESLKKNNQNNNEENETTYATGYEEEFDDLFIGNVRRQDVTPGTQQPGNMNIAGKATVGEMSVEGDSGTNGLTGISLEDIGERKWKVGVQGAGQKGAFAIIDETVNKRRLYINRFGGVFVPGKIKANKFQGDGSLLTGVTATETDPIFGASAAAGITAPQISNWVTAFSWGDHSTAGYLTNYSEADPVFGKSPAKGITGANITNWNTVSWGELAGIPADIADGDQVGITAEVDPEVGANTLNYVPRWDGSALAKGTIFENGTDVGIGTNFPFRKLEVRTGETRVRCLYSKR